MVVAPRRHGARAVGCAPLNVRGRCCGSIRCWQVSGWQGALVASLALFGPSTILAYFVTRAWHKSHDKPWTAIVQNALAPLASGLLLTSAVIILRSTSGGVTPWLIAAASAGIFWRFKTINPLPVLCVGGLVLVLARLWF